ncbi:MAG: enoyl-CoA hydratase/isomerase family protein [Rhodocyclales bacterium]|nr:enoyl-CoA hydratase/isomerase family protein [Rhodocyclales bacterium]
MAETGESGQEETPVRYAVQAGVAELAFNRPHRLNAVNEAVYAALREALRRAEEDEAVRVVLLRGEGRAFCVGADLKAHGSGERTPYQRRRYLEGEQEVCRCIMHLSKPVVAAVHGYALGAGAEMALAADFLLMSRSAKIGFPELSIGNFLGGGVTWLLPRLVGLARARELLFFGERIDGAQAEGMGLANRALDDEGFLEAARLYARTLAEKAPISMELAKRTLLLAAGNSLEAALAAELEGMTFVATTEDWREGVEAFAEKRAPKFHGR